MLIRTKDFNDFFFLNRQPATSCRFGHCFLNRQLNRQLESESASVMLG